MKEGDIKTLSGQLQRMTTLYQTEHDESKEYRSMVTELELALMLTQERLTALQEEAAWKSAERFEAEEEEVKAVDDNKELQVKYDMLEKQYNQLLADEKNSFRVAEAEEKARYALERANNSVLIEAKLMKERSEALDEVERLKERLQKALQDANKSKRSESEAKRLLYGGEGDENSQGRIVEADNIMREFGMVEKSLGECCRELSSRIRDEVEGNKTMPTIVILRESLKGYQDSRAMISDAIRKVGSEDLMRSIGINSRANSASRLRSVAFSRNVNSASVRRPVIFDSAPSGSQKKRPSTANPKGGS